MIGATMLPVTPLTPSPVSQCPAPAPASAPARRPAQWRHSVVTMRGSAGIKISCPIVTFPIECSNFNDVPCNVHIFSFNVEMILMADIFHRRSNI